MNKLRRDIRLAMLGVAAGLFSISLFLLIGRIDAYYTYLEISDGPYNRGVEDLSWLPIAFWHLLLSIVASLMAHRYQSTTRGPSPFFLWQGIGVLVLTGCFLSLISIVTLESLMSGSMNSRLLYTIDLAAVFKFASSVLAGHVMYGSAIQASAREYLEKPADNLCEQPAVLLTHRSFKKTAKQSTVLVDESRRNDNMISLNLK